MAAVGAVVGEVLDGGASGGDIDALLAALPANGGGNAALDLVASPQGESVSGWDMGPDGHLSATLLTNIVPDMSAFHHDAIQPAVNG